MKTLPDGQVLEAAMHIPIHVGWRAKLHSAAWSFGYCKHCQQNVAVRRESFKYTLYLNAFIPLHHQVGTITRCDFCERRIDFHAEWQAIDFSAWSPSEGLPALLRRLGFPSSSARPTGTTDVQLRSLLTAVQQASNPFHVGPAGVFVGGFFGLLVGTLAGYLVFRDRPVAEPRDRVLYICVLGALATCAGAVTGGFIGALLRRNRQALSRIAAAHAKYSLDLFRLSVLSQGYSKRIQTAVNELLHAPNSGIDL
jgi:hypothetical protein